MVRCESEGGRSAAGRGAARACPPCMRPPPLCNRPPGNIYAANGVGCVLAELGYVEQAKGIFLQARFLPCFLGLCACVGRVAWGAGAAAAPCPPPTPTPPPTHADMPGARTPPPPPPPHTHTPHTRLLTHPPTRRGCKRPTRPLPPPTPPHPPPLPTHPPAHAPQVQEAASAADGFWPMPDAWVNLGSVHLAQEQYGVAVHMYATALRRFYHNRDAKLLLYTARAQHDADQQAR